MLISNGCCGTGEGTCNRYDESKLFLGPDMGSILIAGKFLDQKEAPL